LAKLKAIKTCDIINPRTQRYGGAFCHLTQLFTEFKNQDIINVSAIPLFLF
jgi:hypothetical protein